MAVNDGVMVGALKVAGHPTVWELPVLTQLMKLTELVPVARIGSLPPTWLNRVMVGGALGNVKSVEMTLMTMVCIVELKLFKVEVALVSNEGTPAVPGAFELATKPEIFKMPAPLTFAHEVAGFGLGAIGHVTVAPPLIE